MNVVVIFPRIWLFIQMDLLILKVNDQNALTHVNLR